MPNPEPLILISNDDGIDAPGIRALCRAMEGLGEVWVAAPITEQSAVGHAITVRQPVRARPWPVEEVEEGRAFAVTGTPADSIKLALNQLVPRRPDLVVSGINKGPNTAVNVIYSGTVSAATEASILGIDALAFSLCAWEGGDYTPSASFARTLARKVLDDGLPPGILLNVNIPDLSDDELRGVRVTRQARARWEEEFSERKDPFDQPYYWLAGRFVNLDEGEDTDLEAVDAGYVSVTPIQHDLTAHGLIPSLSAWLEGGEGGAGVRPGGGNS